MNLKIGIVGLPNAGKSTLFNALLKRQVSQASNFDIPYLARYYVIINASPMP